MDEAKREADAIIECDARVQWYLSRKNQALYGYWILQMAILTLTAITPVLILVTEIPKAVQALPAALAAIAAGAIGVFQRRATAGAFQVTATRLQNELFLFRTRSGKYANADGDDPTGRSIESMADIESRTIAGWRERLVASAPPSAPSQ
jgi:hypothetical protein